ncbi:hypothetical protein niasHT_006890 [Heterodera trifolii]|uniref:Uncharacterized protein n=1 Tax=Heterodera trifolii TaxID=157864 RepID=A0ABD2LMV9_9BILA
MKIGPTFGNFNLKLLFKFAVITLLLLTLIAPEELTLAAPHRRKRKGSRLYRHHRRSLHEWRRVHQKIGHKHRRHVKIHRLNLDEILRQMDSVVKPRFG